MGGGVQFIPIISVMSLKFQGHKLLFLPDTKPRLFNVHNNGDSICYNNFVGFYWNSKCEIWEKYSLFLKLMMNLEILFYSDVSFT